MKTAFVTLLAATIVWTVTLYLLFWYPLAQQYAGYLIISGFFIIVAWIATTHFYLKLRKRSDR